MDEDYPDKTKYSLKNIDDCICNYPFFKAITTTNKII